MANLIHGIHHVTATVNEAQEDYNFYTKTLGLRLVKKTINFDDTSVYHFYYGNRVGYPGTIMTTFPYGNHGVRKGVVGTGMVSHSAFSIKTEALSFWKARLTNAAINFREVEKFGNPTLQFEDPSGLLLELVGNAEDGRDPWTGEISDPTDAILGFYNVTLSIEDVRPTFVFLEQVMGFRQTETDGTLTRFRIGDGMAGQIVDVSNDAGKRRGSNGVGTIHHVAFRIDTEEQQLEMQEKLLQLGFFVTDVKDRNYFKSIYFRIPGNILFEIATMQPGFPIDEEEATLGTHLKLPDWAEPRRKAIEAALPVIAV